MKILGMMVAVASVAYGQMQPVLGEETRKVSEHVWAIMGFPNIGIVVGERATLVVDTGLGPRNGATISRAAAKLAKAPKLFLVTTHFHPEHAGGEAGFPAGTVLVRSSVQQAEMVQLGDGMLDRFRGMSPLNKELLDGVKQRSADVVFEGETRVDLGGVVVRVMWLGPGHTKGDQLVMVEPDQTLISGDIVQNRVVPAIPGDGGSPAGWIAILDKLAGMNVKTVLPDHSEPGDGTLIAKERAFVAELRGRALELKKQGVSAEEAATRLTAEFKAKYADWPNLNPVGNFVKRVYAGPE